MNGFNNRIRAVFGAAGAVWLDALPALLDECAQRWSLELGAPFDLSYNYVVAATRGDAPVVLKVGVPNPELQSEITAMHSSTARAPRACSTPTLLAA